MKRVVLAALLLTACAQARYVEPGVDDGQITDIRHTMDVFVAQAAPGSAPVFTTARVSEYASGFVNGSTVEQRLQFNPPNLPMFRQGFVPFMGDYIDLAPSAPFVLTQSGAWAFNAGASGSTVSHAVWTDNRDVRAPRDGNWANYTPVTSEALGAISRFDGTTHGGCGVAVGCGGALFGCRDT